MMNWEFFRGPLPEGWEKDKKLSRGQFYKELPILTKQQLDALFLSKNLLDKAEKQDTLVEDISHHILNTIRLLSVETMLTEDVIKSLCKGLKKVDAVAKQNKILKEEIEKYEWPYSLE